MDLTGGDNGAEREALPGDEPRDDLDAAADAARHGLARVHMLRRHVDHRKARVPV